MKRSDKSPVNVILWGEASRSLVLQLKNKNCQRDYVATALALGVGELATLVNEKKDAGNYSVRWNASGFATGMYLVRIQARPTNGGQAGSFIDTKKVLLMK